MSNIWQDSSAIFNTDTNLNTDLSNTCSLNSLTYDSSNNRIYAGGSYNSILNSPKIIPYVSWSGNGGINWQDSSAIFNTDTNLHTDLSNSCTFSSLTYDASNNRIYAGGSYFSILNSLKRIPFVSWSGDGGINWQDSSAIFNTDTNLHTDINSFCTLTSLTYNTTNNRIYAGGYYDSIAYSNKFIPYVSWSADGGISWQDSSAIFNTDTNLQTDVSNSCTLTSLTYDDNNNRIYAGGYYDSSLNYPNKTIPFVSFTNDFTPLPTGPPYSTLEFTNSNIFLNGYNSGLTGLTYYLKVTDIDPITITNITSPLTQVNVKLWADFSNNVSNNIPSGTIIIDGSNITLDGQGLELDLSYNSVGGYEGLVHVNNGSQGINIQNINATIGSGYNLSSLFSTGWICEGSMNNVDISFNNCSVTSLLGDIIINNQIGGGICGGDNSGNNVSFDNCNLIANNINIGRTDNTKNNYNGGICGGNNIGNLLIFTDCRLIANTNIDISGNSLSSYNGGICGGNNDISGSNLTFTNCEVLTKTGDINVRGISTINSFNGGMCGGSNRNTLLNMQTNFNNCQIISNQNISLGGNVSNESNINGGICGGNNNIVNFSNCQSVAQNGSININPTNATYNKVGGICGGNNGGLYTTSNSTFMNCQVIANLQIDISGNGARNDNGGICGGANENTKIEFTNCQVNSLTDNIYIRGIGSQSNFNGGICGGQNSNQASVDMTFTNCNLITDELSDINIEYNNTTKFNGGICGGGNLQSPSTSIFNATFNNCDLITGLLTISGETINYPLNYAQSNQYIENGLIIGGNNKTSPSTIQIDCESKYIDLDNLNYDLDTCCGRTPPEPTPTPPTPSPLGGGTQGVSLKVLHLMEGGNSRAMTRRILRAAFGTEANNKTRKCKTPFRVSVNEQCGNGKPPVIYSGADYIRFKKLKASNQTYNDKSYGGDNSNGSYVSLKRVRN